MVRAGGFPIAGIIANRVYDFPPLPPRPGREVPAALREKLIANYADFAALAARDRAALDTLQREADAPLLAALPVLEEAPASLAGLRRVAALLNTADASPQRRPRRAP